MKILHISDLHFSESTDGDRGSHKHSLKCLKGIERLIDEHQPTRLVLTGDITNIGDKLSLERAYQWVHDRIYSDGEYYGLRSVERGLKCVIVPGNHDAFNAPSSGSSYKRWQSSLSNYYSVFHDYKPETEHGVSYSWAEEEGASVFFCSIDSCYLGDPETEHLGGTLSLSRIAKGKLSRRQSESILSLFDKGMAGELKASATSTVPSAKFLSSLKVLVMHHYLFEPADAKAEPLLQVWQKKQVFQNLAMSDFDVLLCGHKHIADINVSSYSDNFDKRGQIRLAFNYVRRILGIKSLPLSCDDGGRGLSKWLRLTIGFLALSKSKGRPLDEASTREIIGIMERSLQNPAVLKEELLHYLVMHDDGMQIGLFDSAEIQDLYSRIKERFDKKDYVALNAASRRLRGIITHLSGRPFAHIMCASSAKASETDSRRRGINIYETSAGGPNSEYCFRVKRFSWDTQNHHFMEASRQDVLFPAARSLH